MIYSKINVTTTSVLQFSGGLGHMMDFDLPQMYPYTRSSIPFIRKQGKMEVVLDKMSKKCSSFIAFSIGIFPLYAFKVLICVIY